MQVTTEAQVTLATWVIIVFIIIVGIVGIVGIVAAIALVVFLVYKRIRNRQAPKIHEGTDKYQTLSETPTASPSNSGTTLGDKGLAFERRVFQLADGAERQIPYRVRSLGDLDEFREAIAADQRVIETGMLSLFSVSIFTSTII